MEHIFVLITVFVAIPVSFFFAGIFFEYTYDEHKVSISYLRKIEKYTMYYPSYFGLACKIYLAARWKSLSYLSILAILSYYFTFTIAITLAVCVIIMLVAYILGKQYQSTLYSRAKDPLQEKIEFFLIELPSALGAGEFD